MLLKNLVDSDFIMRYLPYMDAKLPVLLLAVTVKFG